MVGSKADNSTDRLREWGVKSQNTKFLRTSYENGPEAGRKGGGGGARYSSAASSASAGCLVSRASAHRVRTSLYSQLDLLVSLTDRGPRIPVISLVNLVFAE